jgi:DNA-binding NarL/FixJ family response regulator
MEIEEKEQKMSEQPIRVIIMVQQPIFRRGIISLLTKRATCAILGLPTSVDEALELARTDEPEVALLDTFCETIDMLEMARQLRTCSPKTAVLLLSEWEGEEWLFQVIKVGVAAYATRNITGEHLVEMLRKVSQGEYLIDHDVLSQPALTSRVLQSFRELPISAEEALRPLEPSPLSNRESEILAHIADGKSNKEIARLLDISDQTVKNHVTSILKKLSVNDRTAAVVTSWRQGWIHPVA